jgi:pimeloyl-ACP methyl ester carboxylesterase
MPKTKINDIDIYYELSGEGVPLLFIHGLGSSSRDWEAQVADFSADYQVLTVDLRGHGRSDKPPGPYSIGLFAADVAGLLHHLKTGPAHVVGLSMGSAVAWHLALDHTQVVRTLVLTNMSAEVPVKTLAARFAFYIRVFIIRVLGMKKLGEFLAPRLFPKPEHVQQREKLIRRWARNDRKASLSALYALKNWSVMNRLEDVKCPVLVVASDQDYSPLGHKEEYVRRMPRAELTVVEDARHGLPLEWPEIYNATVRAFLSRFGEA